MYCVISPDIALRSWIGVPCAFYLRHRSDAVGLTREEFECLLLADGRHDLPGDAALAGLLSRGLLEACGQGERTVSGWSRYRHYNNRYMPKMNLQLTGKCNYNCLHCFNAADNQPLQSEFTFEEVIRLLDEARDCGVHGITLTGGEPLFHPDILRMIDAIYERDMFVFDLNTNGFFLDQAFLDHLKEIGADPLVKISFDGVGYHDWMRGVPGAEEDAVRAIRLCVANGFEVMAQINLNRKNRPSMGKTLELMDELGVKVSRIIRTTEAPRWVENREGECLGVEEYYEAVLEILEQYVMKPRKASVLAWQFLHLYPEEGTFSLEPVTAFSQGRFRLNQPLCKGARGMIAIGADGNVYPCMQMSGEMEALGIRLGNVKTDGLKKLLQSGPYLDCVCQTVQNRLDRNEKCRKCAYLRYCAGGCPGLAMINPENYGDMLGIDPWKCVLFENRWWEKAEKRLKGYRNVTPVTAAEPETVNV